MKKDNLISHPQNGCETRIVVDVSFSHDEEIIKVQKSKDSPVSHWIISKNWTVIKNK